MSEHDHSHAHREAHAFPQTLSDRYRRFRFGNFGPNIEHYTRLAAGGQNPEVMVVSCCDSRVMPETIFMALPGELFVMRNVANLVPPFETEGMFHGVSAALEFAVLNLRVKHIIVLGHSGCGGVKAVLDRGSAEETTDGFITKWMSMLDSTRERVLADAGDVSHDQQLTALEHEGVRTSLANLRTFPCVNTLEGRGKLALHGAYFDIAAGSLYVLNEGTDRFVDP